jgi:hypothetical protein
MRARDGKCEGRRSHLEMKPEMVALAKRLRRRNPKTGERLEVLVGNTEVRVLSTAPASGSPPGGAAGSRGVRKDGDSQCLLGLLTSWAAISAEFIAVVISSTLAEISFFRCR